MLNTTKRNADCELKLSDFPYRSRYFEYQGLRTHYLDEGQKDSPFTIILIHGVPTWSYMYRKIIARLKKDNLRIIAPDLLGFGLSDKPDDKDFYTLISLSSHLISLIDHLNLKNIFLFGHDWGAIIANYLVYKLGDNARAFALCNGFLPKGDEKPTLFFKLWRLFTNFSPVLPIGFIINMDTGFRLKRNEVEAYCLPFRSDNEKVGVRTLPQRFPIVEHESGSDIATLVHKKLQNCRIPLLLIFGKDDPITKRMDLSHLLNLPCADNKKHFFIEGRHFLLETCHDEISNLILNFIKRLS